MVLASPGPLLTPPPSSSRRVQQLISVGREHMLGPQHVLLELRLRRGVNRLSKGRVCALAPHSVRGHVAVRVRPEVLRRGACAFEQRLDEQLHAVHAVLRKVQSRVEVLDGAGPRMHGARLQLAFRVGRRLREGNRREETGNPARARFPHLGIVQLRRRGLDDVRAHGN
jgi:hypothetical protein